MKAIRLTVVGLGVIAAVVLFRQLAHAAEYLNTGNAAGSQNSLNVDLQQSTNVQQNNQGSFSNDINAGANTGGNTGGADTGDASVNVDINNQFNTNQANVDQCCPSPTPTSKPGQPGQSPTPTGTQPPIGGGDGGGGRNGGGGPSADGGGGGVGGGGEVKGLSAAAGENYTEIAITASGIVCLLAGAYLTRKNHLAI